MISYTSLFFISFSCESHDESADNAFENLREDRVQAADSTALYDLMEGEHQVHIDNDETNEFESIDGWNKFKADFKKSAAENAKLVKTMKEVAGLSVENYRKVTHLEKENTALLEELNNFTDSDAVETAKFWTVIEKKMDELKIELGDLNTRISAIVLD